MLRYLALILSIILTFVFIGFGLKLHPLFHVLVLIAGPLALLGIWDMLQTRHSILRNYPILAHIRYLFTVFAHIINRCTASRNSTRAGLLYPE